MAIKVNWHDKNKTLIETVFEDDYTLDEFLSARKKWHRMIKSVDYIVPIVLDMRRTFSPPDGIMRQFIAIHRTPHPRQGHIYIIGLNSPYQKLSKHLFDGVVDPSKSVELIESLDEVIVG